MSDDSLEEYITETPKKTKSSKQIGSDPFTGSHSICDNILRTFTDLNLTSDFANRPLYACPDGHIFLETFSPFYKAAYDFIISIAEPVSRPKYIHEYQISTYSLYTAVSTGLTAEEIIHVLSIFSKVEIHDDLKTLITDAIHSIGKIKLILKNKRYFVQSTELTLLHNLAKKLDQYRVKEKNPDDVYDNETGFIIPDLEEEAKIAHQTIKTVATSLEELGLSIDFDNEDDYFDDVINNEFECQPKSSLISEPLPSPQSPVSSQKAITKLDQLIRRFEVQSDSIRDVRKTALSLNIPFTDEYDFRTDDSIPSLSIELTKNTLVRQYQEKALSKMFGGSRARSGIIVLPCGAGKTLVGIIAAATIKKSTIIFCDSNLAVNQWYEQIKKYTTLHPKHIFVFNSETKTNLPNPDEPCILITTYTINVSGRSQAVQNAMKVVYEREWGLMIMDEVQSLVAETFSKVIDSIKAHSKLGLTATLVREDEKIINLNYLVGPRLYEANWIDLSEQGFIARVKCYEIWCKMTGPFYKAYLEDDKTRERRRIISSLNPNKFNMVERLIRYHESRGDKILVFCDVLHVLAVYGTKLRKSQVGNLIRPVLQGSTSMEDRHRIFSEFKSSSRVNCIFISSIGDKAIDLPDANVLIQICSHFGARMQEAQRLGRILRKKPGKIDEFNAFFYTIVSEDTKEMFFSTKRRQFLTNQGYVFEVVQENDGSINKRWPLTQKNSTLTYQDPSTHQELLNEALGTLDEQAKQEEEEEHERNLEEEQTDVVTVRQFNPFGAANIEFANL